MEDTVAAVLARLHEFVDAKRARLDQLRLEVATTEKDVAEAERWIAAHRSMTPTPTNPPTPTRPTFEAVRDLLIAGPASLPELRNKLGIQQSAGTLFRTWVDEGRLAYNAETFQYDLPARGK